MAVPQERFVPKLTDANVPLLEEKNKKKAIFDAIKSADKGNDFLDAKWKQAEPYFKGLEDETVTLSLHKQPPPSEVTVEVLAQTEAKWKKKLEEVIGLESVKQTLQDYSKSLMLDHKRKQQGFKTKPIQSYHMVFKGNPGTGKTMIAKMVAEILYDLGIVKENKCIVAERHQLIGEYVGKTEPKTEAVVQSAKAGVLFVDEVYRLANPDTPQDYGKEAINTLMSHLLRNDPVMIFAGYSKEMNDFLSSNPGLPRRLPNIFEFADYSVSNLVDIFKLKIKKDGYLLATNVTPLLNALIYEHTTQEQRSMTNGGLPDIMLDFAKRHLNRRLPLTADGEHLITLNYEDVTFGLTNVPMPPKTETGRASWAQWFGFK